MPRTVKQPRAGRPIRSARVVARRERTRESLQRCAQRLFIRKGIAAVSVEEILADAGVSRRTFYGFFASKYELAASIIIPALLEGATELEGLAGRDEAGLVDGIVDCYLHLWEQRGESLALIAALDAEVMPLIEEGHQRFGTALRAALERAAAAGCLRTGDAMLSFRVISRTAVPLLKIYAGHDSRRQLFRESMRGLLGATPQPSS